MKHRVAGKHLNRNSAHRKALRMNFAVAVPFALALGLDRESPGFMDRLLRVATGSVLIRRALIGEAGRQRMQDDFSVRTMVESHIDVYERVLSE